MVTENIAIFPIWGIEDHLKNRDCYVWYTEMLVDAIHKILRILSALNRCYFSSFQFRRMRMFVEQLEIVPDNLCTRIEDLFQAEGNFRLSELRELVRDTVSITESHMPSVDVSDIKEKLDWKQKPWRPIGQIA